MCDKKSMSFAVRSAAEFGSVDARRVAGTAAGGMRDRSSTSAGRPPPTCGARVVIVRERRGPATLGVAGALSPWGNALSRIYLFRAINRDHLEKN